MHETDPLNHLKRRYYKNSNKPLGNNTLHKGDYFSKRHSTTIEELYQNLQS